MVHLGPRRLDCVINLDNICCCCIAVCVKLTIHDFTYHVVAKTTIPHLLHLFELELIQYILSSTVQRAEKVLINEFYQLFCFSLNFMLFTFHC